VRDPFLDRILTGQLNIEGGSPVSIKAGTAIEPRISIVGTVTIESCELQADGLHIRATGKAAGIMADAEDRLPSKLTTILRSTVAMAFTAVIVWLIDKLFNLYDAVKK
jgi:hypothetical protein